MDFAGRMKVIPPNGTPSAIDILLRDVVLFRIIEDACEGIEGGEGEDAGIGVG